MSWKKRLSEASKRAIRTFLQVWIPTFIALVPAGNTFEEVPELHVLTAAIITASWAGFLAVLVWVHNLVEDKTGHSFLKK